MASVVSERYALSMFEVSQEAGQEPEVLEALSVADSLMLQEPAYLKLLSSPMIPKQERCQAVEKAFSGNMNQYAMNFIKILIESGRISLFPEIYRKYRQLYNASRNIQEITATTAIPLSKELREKLQKKLEGITGKTVLLTNQVDPAILGGVVLDIGSRQLDSSVRSRLEKVRSQLAAAMS